MTAGNTVQVTIAETSTPGVWSIVIDNLTTGQRLTTTTPYGSSQDTVEGIEETPLEIGTGGAAVAAMPNLGTVQIQLDNNNVSQFRLARFSLGTAA